MRGADSFHQSVLPAGGQRRFRFPDGRRYFKNLGERLDVLRGQMLTYRICIRPDSALF